MKEIGFRHGIMVDSYEKQANEQGYTLGEKEAELFDKIGKAYNLLRLQGCLTDSQADSICQKIQKKLVANLKPLGKDNSYGKSKEIQLHTNTATQDGKGKRGLNCGCLQRELFTG